MPAEGLAHLRDIYFSEKKALPLGSDRTVAILRALMGDGGKGSSATGDGRGWGGGGGDVAAREGPAVRVRSEAKFSVGGKGAYGGGGASKDVMLL